MKMKAIETRYKGYRFRSRLEARWAVFFDALDVSWEYEKEGYELDKNGRYLPDFWLPDKEWWIEIKGKDADKSEIDKVRELSVVTGFRAAIAQGQIGDHSWIVDVGWVWADGFRKPVKLNQDVLFSNLLLTLPVDTAPIGPTGWGVPVTCPVCQYEYVHFGNAQNVDGEDGYKAWDGRGDAIKIPMSCEAGCEWTLRIGFHKGNSYLGFEDVRTYSEDVGLYLSNWDDDEYKKAIKRARSARFEHGETPGN